MSIDDDLDRLLQRTFDGARPTGNEDVRGLREGAVARAHGLRRRKRVGTVAVSAVATAALVGGVATVVAGGWLGVGTGSTSPASQLSSAPARVQAPVAPETSYALGAFVPAQAALPAGLLYADAVEERPDAGGAVVGQSCDGERVADTTGMDLVPHAVSSADRMALSREDPTGVDAVHVTITGWARGTGAQRFADLQQNRQACRFATEYERLTWPGRDPATTWMVKLGQGEYASYIAAQRIGDVIVAVDVRLRGGEESSRQNAVRLSDAIVARLKASDLSAAKGL